MKIFLISWATFCGLAIYIITDPLHKPKFQIGDCISYFYEKTEFIPEHVSDLKIKVLEIGKKDYKMEHLHSYPMKELDLSSEDIKSTDKYYINVNCEGGNK